MKLSLFLYFILTFTNTSFASTFGRIIQIKPVIWIKPQAHSFVANLNQTAEIGFQLGKENDTRIRNYVASIKGAMLNPFDPTEVDVHAVLTSPSGNEKKAIGFYFQDYFENIQKDEFEEKMTANPWRIRFAPDELGPWTIEIEILIKGNENPILYTSQFICQKSEHKGPLVTLKTNTEKDRNLYYKQTGERFVTAGINISNGGFFSYKPSQNRRQMEGVRKLAEVDGNFVRFEIGAQGALPDWNNIFNYQSKQDEMFAFDRLLSAAEENQIYAILFRHHVEIMGDAWDVPNWKNNPYRQHFNFTKISEYFTNKEAIKWQKNNLRYMYARWGYSPYWSFYGYSELEKFINPIIEQEGISNDAAIQLFRKWIVDQNDFIRSELNPDAQFANSYGLMKKDEKKKGYAGILSASDVTALHVYSTIKNANFVNRAETVDEFWNLYKQPVILEEIGINDDKLALYCCTGIEFHNSIWSTLFMGTTGTGMDWWWDRGVMDFGYEASLKPALTFVQPVQNSKQAFTPYRWSDGRDKKRTLEVYALIREDQQEVYGWLHNATYYWRNLAPNSPCIQGLLDSSNLEMTCVVGENIPIGRNETPRDYARGIHTDKYSEKGVLPIDKGLGKNPSFKIKGVEKRKSNEKIVYRIDFYSTNPNDNLAHLPEYTQELKANLANNLKFTVPNLDDKHPDLAFKITIASPLSIGGVSF